MSAAAGPSRPRQPVRMSTSAGAGPSQQQQPSIPPASSMSYMSPGPPPVRPQGSAGPSSVPYSQPQGIPAGLSGLQGSQSWQFSQPMWPMAPPAQSSLFNVSIKPCKPPRFIGERGQDVVAWLHQVDDYLEFVQPDERQAVAYVTLLLKHNARLWWEAELVARMYRRLDTVAKLKLLLRTAFESPVREQRAQ